jgi:hypothetical protein
MSMRIFPGKSRIEAVNRAAFQTIGGKFPSVGEAAN